jgi:hypothetical protein
MLDGGQSVNCDRKCDIPSPKVLYSCNPEVVCRRCFKWSHVTSKFQPDAVSSMLNWPEGDRGERG